MKKTATKNTNTNDSSAIVIKPVDLRTASIRIVGTTPLIVHAFSEKAKREMLDAQRSTTKVTKKHVNRIPMADMIGATYWLSGAPDIDLENLPREDVAVADKMCEDAWESAIDSGARFGFPATGIKQAAIMAASRYEIDVKTTALRGMFFIAGEGPNQLVEIKGCKPVVREDVCKVGGISKTADLRYRPEFDNWYMDLKIQYNANGPVSLEQIINLINLGGFCCGIGEWRPERDGNYGMFQVQAE